MQSFLHIICILGFISSLLGQPLSNKFILFDAIIITNEGKIDHKVNLFQLSDSAIFITNSSLKKSHLLNHDFGSNRMIRIENIKTIKIRRKGAIRRGFTMGAMTGVLIPFTILLKQLAMKTTCLQMSIFFYCFYRNSCNFNRGSNW